MNTDARTQEVQESEVFICVHLCPSVAVADPYLCSSVASGHLWLSLDQTHAPRFPPFTGRTPTRLQSCDRESPPRLAGGGRGEMASRKGVSVEWRMAGRSAFDRADPTHRTTTHKDVSRRIRGHPCESV